MLHNRLLQNVSTDFDDTEYQTIETVEQERPEQVLLAASDYSPVNVRTLKYSEMPVQMRKPEENNMPLQFKEEADLPRHGLLSTAHGNNSNSGLVHSMSKESIGLTQSSMSQSQGLTMSRAASNAIKAYQEKSSKLELELANMRKELENVRSNKIVQNNTQNQILFEQQHQNALT
jgi:hypothetical protein